MSDTGVLAADLLFKGLTRQPTFFGVNFKFSATNLLLSAVAYAISGNFLILFILMPTLHGIAYILTFNEPLFLEIFILRNGKCPSCKNSSYHLVNSYEVS